MIQLFIIGIVLYFVLYFLAKYRVFNGLTRVFPMMNALIITVIVIILVIKTGLIRIIATFIGTIVALLNNYFSSLF